MSRLRDYLVLFFYVLIVLLPVGWLICQFLTGDYISQLGLNHRQLILLSNSLIIAVGSSLVAAVLGLPLAFFLGRTAIPGKRCLSSAYLVPLLIPPYIQAIVWISLFNRGGLINELYHQLTNGSARLTAPDGLLGCIFVFGVSYFPLVTLIVMSSLSSLDRRFEDAGLLTHSRARVFSKITWPLVRPQVVGSLLLVFIFSLSNYTVPSLLQVNTYPVEIFIQFGAFYDYGAALTNILPLLIITILLLVFHRRLMGRRSYITLGGRTRNAELIQGPVINLLGIVFCLLLFVISIILPIATLTLESDSFATYLVAFKTSGGTILFTFLLAVGSSVVIAFLSLMMGRVIVRGGGDWIKRIAESCSFLPFAIPSTVLGVALILTWNHSYTQIIYSTLLILVLAYVARFVAFSIRIMVAQYRQLNPRLEEAAALVTVSCWRRWLKIDLPLLKPGLIVSWLVAFVLCMRELGVTLLVIPPGRETLTLRIYNLMHYGAEKLVAALCIIVIIISIIPFIILLPFAKGPRKRRTYR